MCCTVAPKITMIFAALVALYANWVSNVCDTVVSIAVVAVPVNPEMTLVVELKVVNLPLESAVPPAPAVKMERKPVHSNGSVVEDNPVDAADVP